MSGRGRRAGAQGASRSLSDRLDRSAADDPLLRARQHDGAQFLCRAQAQPLSRPAGQTAEQAGFDGVLLIMQSNGGVMLAASRAREGGAHAALRTGRRPRRRSILRARARNVDRCITTDMGGTSFEASVAIGMPVTVDRRRDRAPQDRAADARHSYHRRRRRLDRLARRGRPAAHGSAERGRRSGPGLLRQRRHAADHHRRQPRARLSRPRLFRRRQDAARHRTRRGAPSKPISPSRWA